MTPEIIIEALKRSGATIEGESTEPRKGEITKGDLYELGLSGGAGSAEKRKELAHKLALPEKMSANALLDVLNALYTKEELFDLI